MSRGNRRAGDSIFGASACLSRWIAHRAIVLGTLAILAGAVAADDAPRLRTLNVADSTSMCPPGFKRGMFLHLFRLSPEASRQIFPGGEPRTIRVRSSAAAGRNLRARLARLARVDTTQVRGGSAIAAFFGPAHYRNGFLTGAGDGLGVDILSSESGPARVAACVVRDSLPVVHFPARTIGREQMLLLPLTVEGAPHAVTIRTMTIRNEAFQDEQRRFKRGVEELFTPGMALLSPTDFIAAIDRCLSLGP